MARKRDAVSPSPASLPNKKTRRQQNDAENDVVPTPSDSDFVDEPMAPLSSSSAAAGAVSANGKLQGSSSASPSARRSKPRVEIDEDCRFIGEPVPDEEARQRWPYRYQGKKKSKENVSITNGSSDNANEQIQACCHFTQAKVDGTMYNLNDDAYVKAEEGQDSYICKIVEMFEDVRGDPYVTAQWFYLAKDTVIKEHDEFIDNKRVFFSEIKDDNPLDCLVSKILIIPVQSNASEDFKNNLRSNCDFYYDMMYLVPYSTFINLPTDNTRASCDSDSTISSDADVGSECQVENHGNKEMKLLDLYSGCGAMSTGLCLGSNIYGANLVTRWAVDLNEYACESLRLNHPETEVRNESAENFLSLVKEWEQLCVSFSLIESHCPPHPIINNINNDPDDDDNNEEDEDDDDAGGEDSEVFDVEKVLSICYGDPKETGTIGLYFKIRWKGYGPNEDTWEPVDGLVECKQKIKEFVTDGYNSKILPLPGDVDVICGGPPCQGISGFNRFRNKEDPLKDPKNKQLVVYMDTVAFLKPRFVLMENVVDIVKFAKGFLGRYALGRLVGMNYQARIGMMAAGAYGLAQFRMRVFLWGALQSEKLPQYPLPTHNVAVRGVIPLEFEQNTVGYEEGKKVELEKELSLEDAISDLPSVKNDEGRDEMDYDKEPKTEFQKFIRLGRHEMPGCLNFKGEAPIHALYDHRPLQLNDDDYLRVCQIPQRKGANFRDLAGVRVRLDNKVEWDPDVERVYLPSGKPLVPDYAMSFVGGSSSKPFGRLWWDEIVPTVVTRAEPHNQALLHPTQNRVLTIRENARLQGFPDYYKLVGPIKERYIQVGNAVAVPVARALGYSLGMAAKGFAGDSPLFTLPTGFPKAMDQLSPDISM